MPTNITYSADNGIAVTAWDSLAADDWASSADVDNTTDLFLDMLVGGELAASATTLGAGESFDIYVTARYDKDLASSYGGGLGTALTAADSTLQLDVEFNPENFIFFATVGIENTAPDTTQDYMWGPRSVAAAFGGILPQHYMFVLHNNTGSAMGTGNVMNGVGITFTTT